MNQKIEQMNRYFEENITECGQKKNMLLSDDRKDEANFWQIRANIYDVFRTILSVAVRTEKEEDEIRAFMDGKFAEMTGIWAESGRKAQENGASSKAAIEQIKVETAGEIRKKFEQTWSE